jgi:hypothetical protein
MGTLRHERRWLLEALAWALAVLACDVLLRAAGLPPARSGTSLLVWLICATGLQRTASFVLALAVAAMAPRPEPARKPRRARA